MSVSVGVHALSLAAGEIAVIAAPEDLRVQVRRGCAWITRDGDLSDTLLTPREREWRVPAAGRLVVQAMDGPLQLALRRLPQPQRAARWLERLHGVRRALGVGTVGRLPEAW